MNGNAAGEFQDRKGCRQKLVEDEALALDGVIRALEGKAPKRVIVVPNRIVNIVA